MDIPTRWCLIGAGLLWGLLSGFSVLSEDSREMAAGLGMALGLGLGTAGIGVMSFLAWMKYPMGGWIALHVLVAFVSGVINHCPLENVIRYAALLPAFSLFLAVAARGRAEMHCLRLGITFAGLILVGYHLVFLELGALLDPSYRLTVIVNTNSIAFVASLTALSVLDFAAMKSLARYKRVLWFAAFVGCVLILISTKSRTAMLAFMAGLGAYGMVWFRKRGVRGLLVTLLALAFLGAFWGRGQITSILSLDDPFRSIDTGTGRYAAWEYVLNEVWMPAPLLGVGPGNHYEMVYDATTVSSAHNGLLMVLSETGLLGALPLVIVLLLCGRFMWIHRDNTSTAWVACLCIAGLTESIGETMFFSIGNPASLLFLLAIASAYSPQSAVLGNEATPGTTPA